MTSKIHNYNFEFVFTDNASSDETFKKLEFLSKKDNRIRVFSFSKNFGYQASIYTGYCKAKGAAIIEYDCDLQDPPEMLPEFISYWEKGYKIVYGERTVRDESFIIQMFRKIFYRLISRISSNELPKDAGDFFVD